MKASRLFRKQQRSGIALVLVLSILILLTAVVVAFFTNATTDLTASKGYSDAARVQLLGDSAVNLVEAQIRAATQGGTGGSPEAWASQPGMIQTYDQTGTPKKSYKLYSAASLQVDGRYMVGSTTNPPAPEFPDDWNLHPSDYVDLNSPSIVSDPSVTAPDPTLTNAGKLYSARFPIVDGNNLRVLNGNLTYNAPLGNPPSTGPNIEGFYVQPPASYKTGNLLAPNNNPVAMPVRWLYQLQDGQLQPRDPSTGRVLNASKDNPIVSRLAFWTDDDTCKLNINTASEGTDWSIPRVMTRTDYLTIAKNLPAQNEFQMFSGHPAKTCLSTVFSSILPPFPTANSDGSYSLPVLLDPNSYANLLPYYDLVPRITQGSVYGSAGGTKVVPTTVGIPYDTDRLYTSVDEIMFKPQMTTSGNPPVPTRTSRSVNWDVDGTGTKAAFIPASFLETTRFFLTASNRAPEVTLLNTPRISLWPLPLPQYESSKERLLAFCGTIPSSVQNNVATGFPYYFQRAVVAANITQPTTGLSSDSPTLDFTAVPRNSTLYTYLQKLLEAKVPGLGGSFQGKYPATYKQITTEVVDQLRSGVNTWPTTVTTASGANQMVNYTQPRGTPGEAQVTPLLDPGTGGSTLPFGNTKGFGRYSTITEVALDLFRADDPSVNKTGPIAIGAMLMLQPFNPSPGFPTWSPDFQVTVDGLYNFQIEADDAPQGFTPKPHSLGFLPQAGTNIVNAVVGFNCIGNPVEYNTLATMFTNNYPFLSNPTTPIASSIDPMYGVNGNGFGQLPPGTTKFRLNPTSAGLTIYIYANPIGTANGAHGPLIQTLQMNFPTASQLPVPLYGGGGPGVAAIFKARLSAGGALARDDQPSDNVNSSYGSVGCGTALVGKTDIVRSVVVAVNGPSKGDLRVIAGLKNVPSNYFTVHPFYDAYASGIGSNAPYLSPPSSKDNNAYNWQFADSLKIGDLPGWGGLGYYKYSDSTGYLYQPGVGAAFRKSAYTGSLVTNVSTSSTTPPYAPVFAPAVPVGLNGAFMYAQNGTSMIPGDWDTGPGNLEDGPYINKPDEGNTNSSSGSAPGYYARQIGNLDTGGSYSPNRERASAVEFGSLPTGIDPSGAIGTTKPWQSLLFCANPAAGLYATDPTPKGLHPGFGAMVNPASVTGAIPAPPYKSVPDHYMLDLFTMPIVEPYAISEPLSSQGKVNMNYQIAPFTYIHRETGVRAVLKGSRMLAIPSTAYSFQHYKAFNSPDLNQFRYDINPDDKSGTLKFFEDRFSNGDIFHSASEICSVPLVPAQIPNQSYDPLVPANPDAGSLQAFWNACQLTGDNVREEPYNDIYPRLTTKSNTYTVHVRVQTLKKALGGDQSIFVDPTDPTPPATAAGGTSPKDAVTAEYRGSYQIERYVDPNVSTSTASGNGNAVFPDYATVFPNVPDNQLLGNFYKFHTIGTKQF